MLYNFRFCWKSVYHNLRLMLYVLVYFIISCFECGSFIHKIVPFARFVSQDGYNPPYVMRDILSMCDDILMF